MLPDSSATRRLSAALFGNEKVVEVVLALNGLGPATAQGIASQVGIAHSMVRDVLVRLTSAGILLALPRIGGSRSPQYYEPADAEAWAHLLALARWVAATQPADRS